jgi:integrase
MDVGLRPGEMFGLHGHRVDWLRGRIAVVDVMTRQGLREYPKSRKSHRVVPVPPAMLERLPQPVWLPAVAAAGIRRFPPRIMRHTAASWLVMDGVPLYDVQALPGHESFAPTQRYAHLAPDAHSRGHRVVVAAS